MIDDKKIGSDYSSLSQSESDSSSFVDSSLQSQNSESQSDIQAVIDRMRLSSNTASTARSFANDYKTEAVGMQGQVKNATSVDMVKQIIQAIRELIMQVKEQMNIMKTANADVQTAKIELEEKSRKVPGTQNVTIPNETQNNFFDQKMQNPITDA